MSNLLRSRALWRARDVARRWTDTHLDRPVARTVMVGTALKRGRADVLYLGDSSLIHIAHGDTDRRRMGEMLAGELGGNVAQFFAPGTSVGQFNEVIRLAMDLPRPRCVVVSMVVRSSTHVHATEHPIFGWQHATDTLRSTAKFGPRLATRVYRHPATDADYARFEAIERKSVWNLASTVGEYRAGLRGYDPDTASEDRRRLIFDYFHGEYSAGHPGLAQWRQLGERLRMLDVPVLAYRCLMPFDAGTRMLGPEFVPHLENNFSLIEEEFFGGLGGGSRVEIPTLGDDCFVNWADATEHLNERGRRRVVETLIPAIRSATA